MRSFSTPRCSRSSDASSLARLPSSPSSSASLPELSSSTVDDGTGGASSGAGLRAVRASVRSRASSGWSALEMEARGPSAWVSYTIPILIAASLCVSLSLSPSQTSSIQEPQFEQRCCCFIHAWMDT